MHESSRLSAHLGVRLFFKREDVAPLALGGNKLRKLELTLGRALADGYDTIITTGAVQSNHCRLAAAAAAKLGLACYLVLRGAIEPICGNLLLDALFNARISTVDANDRSAADASMAALAERLSASGHRPFVIPLGGIAVDGVAAFIECAAEIATQARDCGCRPGTIVVAGTGPTFVGLWIGSKLFAPATRVIGVSVMYDQAAALARVRSTVAEACRALPLEDPGEPEIVDRYVGAGYGIPSPAGLEALHLVAEQEGVLLDPTYTAKAFAGLMGELHDGNLARGEPIVFVHTGGTPALFSHDPSPLCVRVFLAGTSTAQPGLHTCHVQPKGRKLA